MAQTISPKADQPKVTTESLKRGSQPAALEYRVQRSSTNNRGPATKDYGRSMRGQVFLHGRKGMAASPYK